jgi:hypothetical protein
VRQQHCHHALLLLVVGLLLLLLRTRQRSRPAGHQQQPSDGCGRRAA